ncbi:MAG TPA: glycosyltransferase family 39 protein [Terriglobia bacterium]|nr:glycosyltransferase family 39 protein [Terriglobia bacterium]
MNPRYQLFLILAVAACIFFAGLGSLPLTEPDEGRNAEVAREMIVQHDWITPHYDNLTYLDKPALFFWLAAGSLRLFGTSEWAARLPSVLAALGTLLLVWMLARRMFGESAGTPAGLVFATAPLVMVFARVVVFDMTLTFLVTLTLTAFWLSQVSMRRPLLEYLMFAAAGAATITKGPVGFLVPLLAILVYAAVQRRFADLKKIAWTPGIAIFLAVSLPWFIAVSVRHPDFPRYAFWDESILRFTTGRARRGGSVFYYIPVFLVGFLPWSLTLTFAALNRLKRWRRFRERDNAPEAFLLSWGATVFVFFSISHSKLPSYFLPAIPALAVLMGRIWSADVGRDTARPRPDWLTAGYASLIALGLLLAAAPAWLQAASVHKRAVEKIHPRVLELLSGSIFSSGIILAALGILGRNLAGRAQQQFYTAKCFAVLALAMPLVALRWWQPIRQYALVSSSKSLAEAIDRGPDRGMPVYGYYYFRTSLPFYLQRPVGLVTGDASQFTSNYVATRLGAPGPDRAVKMMAADGVALPLVVTGSEFTALGRSPPAPFLVMVRNDQNLDIENLPSVVQPLWTAWKYSVWEVSARASSR